MTIDNGLQFVTAVLVLGTYILKRRADKIAATNLAVKVEAAHSEIKSEVIENTAITSKTNELVNGRYSDLVKRVAFLETALANQVMTLGEREKLAKARAELESQLSGPHE